MGWTDVEAARVGAWIRAARESRGFNYAKDLADAAEIGRSTISPIENGRGHSTTSKTQRAIEDTLGVPHGTLQRVAVGDETRMPADIPDERDKVTEMVAQLSKKVASLEKRVRALGG